MKRGGWAVVTLCAWTGCGEGADPRPAEWAYIHAAVIRPSCTNAGCHTSEHQTAGLDLERPAESAALLLSGGYVVPGDPQSTLLVVLEGSAGLRMPPNAPLPRADVELIRRWIDAGAPTP